MFHQKGLRKTHMGMNVRATCYSSERHLAKRDCLSVVQAIASNTEAVLGRALRRALLSLDTSLSPGEVIGEGPDCHDRFYYFLPYALFYYLRYFAGLIDCDNIKNSIESSGIMLPNDLRGLTRRLEAIQTETGDVLTQSKQEVIDTLDNIISWLARYNNHNTKSLSLRMPYRTLDVTTLRRCQPSRAQTAEPSHVRWFGSQQLTLFSQ